MDDGERDFEGEEEKDEDGINVYHKGKVKDKKEILHFDPMPWALHRIHRYAHPATLRANIVTWCTRISDRAKQKSV